MDLAVWRSVSHEPLHTEDPHPKFHGPGTTSSLRPIDALACHDSARFLVSADAGSRIPDVVDRHVPNATGGMYSPTDALGVARPGTEFVRPSLQAALEDLGYRFGRAEEYLISRPPTHVERETPDLDSGEWIVQLMRTSYSTEDTPIHALETVCDATRHVFPIGQVARTDEL